MISCDKAAHICSKNQYKEASWLDRLKLRSHLTYCKTCSAFSKKNTRLTQLFKKSDIRILSESDKTSIKRKIQF